MMNKAEIKSAILSMPESELWDYHASVLRTLEQTREFRGTKLASKVILTMVLNTYNSVHHISRPRKFALAATKLLITTKGFPVARKILTVKIGRVNFQAAA